MGGSSTVVAVGIPPTSLRLSRRHLCPFALVPDFPASLVGRDSHDDYEHSVTVALAGCRPSHGSSPVSVRGCGRWSTHPREEARCLALAVRRGRRPSGQCPRTQQHRRRRSDLVSVTMRRLGMRRQAGLAFTMAPGSCGTSPSIVFGRPPLSHHALVPFSFQFQVGWVTREHLSEFSLLPAG